MSHDPAGSPRPFDFGDEASATGAEGPVGNPFEDQPAVPQSRRRRFSWIALIIAVGVSLLVGLGGYQRAAAYADGWDVDSAVLWVAVSVLCVVAALAAVVIAIVAVVRGRPSAVGGSPIPLVIAVIALVVALVLPWLAASIGASLAPLPPTP